MQQRKMSHPGQLRASIRKKAVQAANQQELLDAAKDAGMTAQQLSQQRLANAQAARLVALDLKPFTSGDHIPKKDWGQTSRSGPYFM